MGCLVVVESCLLSRLSRGVCSCRCLFVSTCSLFAFCRRLISFTISGSRGHCCRNSTPASSSMPRSTSSLSPRPVSSCGGTKDSSI